VERLVSPVDNTLGDLGHSAREQTDFDPASDFDIDSDFDGDEI